MKPVGFFAVVFTLSVLMVTSIFVQGGGDNALIEQIETLEKQLEELENNLQQQSIDKEERINELENKVDSYIEQVEDLDERVTLLEARFLEQFAEKIEESVDELEAKALNYLNELDKIADAETMKELEEEIDYYIQRINEIDKKIEETTDIRKITGLLEEMEQVFKEMVLVIEDTLRAEEEREAQLDKVEGVEEDLLSYYEKIKPLGQKEQRIVMSFHSVTGDNYTDDETFYRELEDKILPGTKELIDELENIVPETGEVQDLHDLFVEGWLMQQKAFTHYRKGIVDQDHDKITEGNQLLEKGYNILSTFSEELDEMAQKYGLELD